MEENFSQADLEIFVERSISLETLASQFQFFINGIPKIILDRPAKIDDGILSLSEVKAHNYAAYFDSQKTNFKIVKFVPASGAASRMFKFLSEFLANFRVGEETITEYCIRTEDKELLLFFDSIDKFPFYNLVLNATRKATANYEKEDLDFKKYAFVKTMLSEDYFDFSNQPKGVLPFHSYPEFIATPVEEHLNECLDYAIANKKSYLHFTISDAHQSKFEKIILEHKNTHKEATEIEISYSYQSKATDVIAYNLNNTPFRDRGGNLVFRPGGHGALIENLNQLEADLIFIKNIDNVLQNQNKTVTLFKKALAGILIENQQKVFEYVSLLKNKTITDGQIQEALLFLNAKLFVQVANNFDSFSFDHKIEYLLKVLNRPIRVCGMVKNDGEPGGGPFWVSDKTGTLSLQIIEASQVDNSDQVQLEVLNNATHFNPVDLVCGTKDNEGNKFNLTEFVDNTTGFIVQKAKDGLPYKAFELPGLWNGAMAGWLTIFVEVPSSTFNPVKTVNDLLKPEHQA